MTESDAKKLWCPMARAALTEGMAANRTASMGTGAYADITGLTRCIASQCMAWRWRRLNTGPDEGYCGLAGQP